MIFLLIKIALAKANSAKINLSEQEGGQQLKLGVLPDDNLLLATNYQYKKFDRLQMNQGRSKEKLRTLKEQL